MSVIAKLLGFLIITLLTACSNIQLIDLAEIEGVPPVGRNAKYFYPYELDMEGRSKGLNYVNYSYRIHSGDAVEFSVEGNTQVKLEFHISGDRTDHLVISGKSRIRVPIALFLIGNIVNLNVGSNKHSICLFQKKGRPCRPPRGSPKVQCLNKQSSWADIHRMIIEGGCGMNEEGGGNTRVNSGCRSNGDVISCKNANISVNLLPAEQVYLFPGDRFSLEVIAHNYDDDELPKGIVHSWPYIFPGEVDAFGYIFIPRLRIGSELDYPNINDGNDTDKTKIALKRIANTTIGDVNSRIRTWWPGAIMGRYSTITESENMLPDASLISRCLAIGDLNFSLPTDIDQCTRLGTDLSRIYPKIDKFERVTYRISPMTRTWTLVDEQGRSSEIKYVFGTSLHQGVITHYPRLTGKTLLRPHWGWDRNSAYLTVIPDLYRAEAAPLLNGPSIATASKPFFVKISPKHVLNGSTTTLIWPGDRIFVTREEPCCTD